MLQSGLGPDPGPLLAQSPSLSGYASGTIAQIAARVISEFANDNPNDVVPYSVAALSKNDVVDREVNPKNFLEQEEKEDGDSDFEFAVPGIGGNPSPISADEIFQNGQIKPLFRVFNANFAHNPSILSQPRSPEVEKISKSKSEKRIPIRLPLKKLMICERETSLLIESVSCSSSDSDKIKGVNLETYCVWTPNKHEMMRKNSPSSRSSKRWNFRDLLYRIQRDGGDDLVLSKSKSKKLAPAKVETSSGVQTMKKKKKVEKGETASYLIEWFANMNGLSRTVQPF